MGHERGHNGVMPSMKFSVPEDLRAAVKAQAAKEYCSDSQLIRRAIREYLDKTKEEA